MNDRKKKNLSSTPEEREISILVQSKPRINRLRRSPRPSQTQTRTQEPSNSAPDFKTPTRPAKGRFRSSVTEESPNNESEFQHDIIWDQNSPATPFRNGRGRRRATNVKLVDISEIVNRIAPKSRRPEEAESSLLQWIGDSAIPCTPEVQEPRTKPKSARPNVVDDLLRLAKQFDFNMIQQDEAHLQAKRQSSEGIMEEDQELFYDENNITIPLQNETEAEGALHGLEEAETNGDDYAAAMDDLALVQEMEDDLDLLFDSSTQQISGCLSQDWSDRSQGRSKITQSTAAVNGNCTGTDGDVAKGAANVLAITATLSNNSNSHHAAGVDGASKPGIAAATLSNSKEVFSANDFDDDWSNDDLLDDSLVFEMTQNPQLFSAPQHSSTQKQMNRKEGVGFAKNMNGTYHHQQASSDVKDGASQGFHQKLRSRQTFQLDPQLTYQWNEASGNLPNHHNVLASGKPTENIQQRHVLPVNRVPPVAQVSRISNPDQLQCNISKANVRLQDQTKVQRPSGTSKWGAGTKTSLISSSASSVSSTSYSLQLDKVKEKQNQPTTEELGLRDIGDEDLDSIFASDDIWDDGADDDDLFCEVCEKVEEFTPDPDPLIETSVAKPTTTNTSGIQSRTPVFSTQTGRNTTNMSSKQHGMFVQPYPPYDGTHNTSAVGKNNGFSTCPTLLAPKSVLPGANTLNYRSMSVGNTPDNSFQSSSTLCKGPYKFTQIKGTSGMGSGAFSAGAQQQGSERGVVTFNQSFNQSAIPDDHQFKKPFSTVSAAPVITKDVCKAVASRCSDAEIERKRQEAMERRRLRTTASQNLWAPI